MRGSLPQIPDMAARIISSTGMVSAPCLDVPEPDRGDAASARSHAGLDLGVLETSPDIHQIPRIRSTERRRYTPSLRRRHSIRHPLPLANTVANSSQFRKKTPSLELNASEFAPKWLISGLVSAPPNFRWPYCESTILPATSRCRSLGVQWPTSSSRRAKF